MANTELEPFIWQKNAKTQVRAYTNEYNGKTNLHIREWWFDGDADEWKPGKGVAIPLDKVGEFAPGLLGFMALLQTPAPAPLPKAASRAIKRRV